MATNRKASEAHNKLVAARLELERSRPVLFAEIERLEEGVRLAERTLQEVTNDLSNWQ